MRRKACCFLPLLFSLPALAQKPAPQQVVTVTVVDVHADHPQPVSAIIVSLGSLDGVSFGKSSTTARGEAFLHVSSETMGRDDLRIEIRTDANPAARDLVIFEPADGQVHGLAQTLPVKLLPKGSPALEGPAQIEAVQRRLSQRVATLQGRTQRQQSEITGLKGLVDAQKQAVNSGLEEWAKANGLNVQLAQKKVLEWAQQLQAQPSVSAERRALAAFALTNYGEAADLFGEATDAEMASLDAVKKQQQEQNRVALQKILETTEQRANALQLTSRNHDATAALTKTRDYLAAQHKASPEDAPLRNLWLDAVYHTAGARLFEADNASPSEVAGLLSQCVNDYVTIQREFGAAGDRLGLALGHEGMGNVLREQGEHATGDSSAALFEQAVQAYRSALEVYTREASPQAWAATQMNLGITLRDESEGAGGSKFAALLDQAVQAYRSALEVRTRENDPQAWAKTQVNIGVALFREGEYASGDQAVRSLREAESAYRSALEVFTKVANPQAWAKTQMNLAGALLREGEHASQNNAVDHLVSELVLESQRAAQKTAADLLDQAVQAYRNALEVYTRADLPQAWAATQMGLGAALDIEAIQVSADKSVGLLEQAVQANRNALEVYTKADVPQNWAAAELNLGTTLLDEGERGSGDNADRLVAEAIEAYQSALQIYTQAAFSGAWAKLQFNLGNALLFQGDHANGSKAAGLYNQASQAYSNALEVYTKADMPYDWAQTTRSLALVYDHQGKPDAAREARAAAQAVDPQ